MAELMIRPPVFCRKVFGKIVGQPTVDSEIALLVRMLVESETYDPDAALQSYRFWRDSDPFDCGMTISAGLRGRLNPDGQANVSWERLHDIISNYFRDAQAVDGDNLDNWPEIAISGA